MELPVWNTVLSFASAALLLWVKISHDEVKRLSILLSKTREENSEKFVAKMDMHNDMNRVIQRLFDSRRRCSRTLWCVRILYWAIRSEYLLWLKLLHGRARKARIPRVA